MQPRTNQYPYPQPAGLPVPDEDTDMTIPASQESAGIEFPFGSKESDYTNYAKTRNAVFQTWWDPQIKAIGEMTRMFRNAPTAAKSGKSVALPIASGIVESINSRLQPTLLNRPKIVEAVPNFMSDSNDTQNTVEEFVNEKALAETRKPEKGKQGIKSAVVESMIIWRNKWVQETVKTSTPIYVPDPNWIAPPMPPQMPGMPPMPMPQPPQVYQGEQAGEISKARWEWELESLANMAWDPHTVTSIKDSPWARKRAQVSYNDLLRMQAAGNFKGVERLRYVVPKGAEGYMKEGWLDELKRAAGDNNWNFTYANEKLYQVEEWWADMTFQVDDGTGVTKPVMKKMVWFQVEDAYVVSVDENFLIPQRLPWDSCPLIQVPHSMTGMGSLTVVQNVQQQINTYAGYQDTLSERMAKPTIFYDESSGISARTQFMRAYGMQPVQNVQGIKEMTLSADPLKAVQAYIEFLMTIMREASGANEQFQGIDGADTATEFQGLEAAAGSRFSDMADTLMQGWLEKIGQECYLFYRQFGQDGQMFAHSGGTEGQVTPITRQMLAQDYTFVAASAANDKANGEKLKSTMEAIQMGAGLPPSPDGTMFNAQKAYRDTVLPILGQKNGSDWFTQAPPKPPMGAGGPPPPGM